MENNIFRELSNDAFESQTNKFSTDPAKEAIMESDEHEEEWAENYKSELVTKFRQWLEKQPLSKDTASLSRLTTSLSSQASGKVSMFNLLSELTALKQETKIANRQLKTGMDQWEKMHESAQQAINVAQRAQGQLETEGANQKRPDIRKLLKGILDIRDRMERGIKAAEKISPSFYARLLRVAGGKDELREGQKMTLRNLDRLLASFGVSAIPTLWKKFDPYTMRVVEVENWPYLANGTIVEEIRKGFKLNEEVLRPAEVKVNKREGQLKKSKK